MTTAILSECKKELIMNNRTSALKIARSLLRRWGVYMDTTEVQSITDIALCEAARGFDLMRGTNFITYLFPYIKGALVTELKFSKRMLNTISATANCEGNQQSSDDEHSMYEISEYAIDEQTTPEHLTYRGELRKLCREALNSLLPLEREALIAVDICEDKVAVFARKIGYSRPYISSVRTKALCKIQPFMERMAA
jgi:RNA polymerase sigma factor (sigma-70 family)